MLEPKPDFDYQAVCRYLQHKHEIATKKRQFLWQQATLDTQVIVNRIIECYQPKRIIQWGSLLKAQHFSEVSDIDLAIEGVGSVEFLGLLALAEDCTDFPLDILRRENVDPAFQATLLAKGKILYEQR
ncbi:nucleotidyltransferase domain-containing protein [Rhodoferax sp. 4810]|uniref:Nucleotidyltransferase domain-containing protein n=1 Tax=Thiospirillum jenense TaxID=1653858 RepID=A0A839HGX0_9GAMM|nr:nucleotidyltransferase domain-containing protein [Thiospirillum jenense]MBB1074309.1 nucleotidyltransferase domain-containing protein [Rhodoferax jenense]MBB1126486.1 nucleotidyltransferase domain-containing protein [Thiospirillum jenense]